MDRRQPILAGAFFLLALIVAVVLIAGGDDGGEEGETSASADRGEKPTIAAGEGQPPRQLEVEDLEVGEGPEAQAGDTVTVDYVGALFSDGSEFDASFGGEPFELQLGAGSVIPGWEEGLEGMQVGGRRQLTIPPRLAYGEQGSPPAIPPNATLIFIVDLLAIS